MSFVTKQKKKLSLLYGNTKTASYFFCNLWDIYVLFCKYFSEDIISTFAVSLPCYDLT